MGAYGHHSPALTDRTTSARAGAEQSSPAGRMLTRPAATRGLRGLAFATTAAATIAALLAHALAPLLVRDAPLLLLALYPSNAHLLLISAKVGLVPLVAVAMARRIAADTAAFLLGRWYGERAVRWIARRAGRRHDLVAGLERAFPRLAQPLVFLFASTSKRSGDPATSGGV